MGYGADAVGVAAQAFGLAMGLLVAVFAAGVASLLVARALRRAWARAAVHAEAARGLAEIERFLTSQATRPGGEPGDGGRADR